MTWWMWTGVAIIASPFVFYAVVFTIFTLFKMAALGWHRGSDIAESLRSQQNNGQTRKTV